MLKLHQSELVILTQKIVHLLRTQKRMKKKEVDQASSADIVAKLSVIGIDSLVRSGPARAFVANIVSKEM